MVTHVIGVDLAQTCDYSAFAVLERNDETMVFDVRHLERHRQRSYPQLIGRLRGMVQRLPSRPFLAVDATGVGPPVIDLIRTAQIEADLYPITITEGDQVVSDGIARRVPKRDLVSTVAVLLQTNRLRFVQSLPLAPLLRKELSRFRAHISIAGNDTR